MFVSQIQPGNAALAFIDRRLLDDKYRGSESSEHNRYDMNEIYQTLSLLNKFAPRRALMKIRDTDLSKRPVNRPDEIPYARFCEAVKMAVGKGTQDSIRKNIFVDLHRMDLIERHDENRRKLSAFGGGSVKYVSLSPDGLKFIESNLLDRAFVFSRALDKLLGGYIELSLDILRNGNYGIGQISKWEFMFFVSAVGTDTTFNITVGQCVDLIKSYRLLAPTQRRAVIETLKQKLQPQLFIGDKTRQRDWHNWQNKIDQVYHLFRQTPYFEISGSQNEILQLSARKITTESGEQFEFGRRSSAEKLAYHLNHKVNQIPGFELHHVIPLSWSGSPEQYKLIDSWKNMVYIDAFSHAKITQNHNRNIKMSSYGDDLILSDYNDGRIYLVNRKNLAYDIRNQPTMLAYNEELRLSLK
ncbi:MAG: hypothetical protein LBM73_00035 [Candidatus Nomurabacteria bacterium]|jgi:hypothetical protein|nr:hypothetical protein [Candidatus Nomurabacteria bacterium]